jgi:lipopolysaccharide transport system ATP-binding protein
MTQLVESSRSITADDCGTGGIEKQGVNTNVVIQVQDVAKAYTIWSSPAARLHGPLLGRVGQMPFLPSAARNLCNRLSHESFRNFHALRNVSFTVRQGECIGVIGRNGSGKSTLLQVVAGTLEPSEGTVSVQGKVAALLELGSGFNAEFTGRENVEMYSTVLGLSRDEARGKFAEIEAFADIGEFIDQPTKTYSSGMIVRLAFAVQAAIIPDILIVDEALSVGDEAFQRKCYARLQTLQQRGTTILFASHATNTVVELCQRAILLEAGELLIDGPPKLVAARYHKLSFAPPEQQAAICQEIRELNRKGIGHMQELVSVAPADAPRPKSKVVDEDFHDPGLVPKSTVAYPSRGATIENPQIRSLDGRLVNVLKRGEEYVYAYTVTFTERQQWVRFGMLIKTVSGYELGGAVSHAKDSCLEFVAPGSVVNVEFPFRCSLAPGVYFLNAGVLGMVGSEEAFLHRLIDVAMFRVQPEDGLLATAVIDFHIEPRVSFRNDAGKPPGSPDLSGRILVAPH